MPSDPERIGRDCLAQQARAILSANRAGSPEQVGRLASSLLTMLTSKDFILIGEHRPRRSIPSRDKWELYEARKREAQLQHTDPVEYEHACQGIAAELGI